MRLASWEVAPKNLALPDLRQPLCGYVEIAGAELDFGARCAICEVEQIVEDKERCAAVVEAMNAIVDNLMELDKATASDKEERNRQKLARGVKVGFLKSTWSF